MNFDNFHDDVQIIGFCGELKAGKTTCAGFVSEIFGHTKVSFATAVKQVAKDVYGWNGEKDYKGRLLLQRIGTDCGRMYNPDIWVHKTAQEVEYMYLRKINNLFVIDDLRFNNEADYVHRFKYSLVIKIAREIERDELSKHESEKGISLEKIDLVVNNNGTIEELKESIINLVNEFYKKEN